MTVNLSWSGEVGQTGRATGDGQAGQTRQAGQASWASLARQKSQASRIRPQLATGARAIIFVIARDAMHGVGDEVFVHGMRVEAFMSSISQADPDSVLSRCSQVGGDVDSIVTTQVLGRGLEINIYMCIYIYEYIYIYTYIISYHVHTRVMCVYIYIYI